MSAKILFLGRYESRPGYETPERFKEHMPEHFGEDYEVYAAHFEDLRFDCATGTVSIRDMQNNLDLAEYDFVFLIGWFLHWRDFTLAVASYLDFKKVSFLNPEALHQRSSAKLSQAVIFGIHDLPIPRTLFAATYDEDAIDWIFGELGSPLILKQTNASKGANNYLVENSAQLKEILKKPESEDIRFIAQAYIPNEGDYRVICGDNKVYMIIERVGSDDSHLNNTSQGAVARELPLSSLSNELRQVCVDAAQLVYREFCGVDLMKDATTGEFYVLEANNMPQMLSGVFPERKGEVLASIVKDTLKHKQ